MNRYPHLDMVETGKRVASQLLDLIARVDAPTPRLALATLPLLSHTLRSSTVEPTSAMSHAVRRAKYWEDRDDSVLSVNVFAGFALADVPAAGVSVVVVHRDSVAEAKRVAADVSRLIWEQREGFVYTPEPLHLSIARAVEMVSKSTRPILLLDHGDNLMSGGTCATATLLSELIRLQVPGPYAVGPLCDANAVKLSMGAHEGGTLELEIGTHPSVKLTVVVKRISIHGEFVVTGPIYNGLLACMGASVALEFGAGNTIVVTSKPFEPYDIGCFSLLGVDPSSYRYLLLKSRMYARPVFEPLAGGLVECDTRGSTSSDYSLFHHENIRRPIFPLDKDCTFKLI
jgi:microcystin degradation protein MlrC